MAAPFLLRMGRLTESFRDVGALGVEHLAEEGFAFGDGQARHERVGHEGRKGKAAVAGEDGGQGVGCRL